MHKKKQDRRVQRTRKLLREALIELVPEKGYYSISIQDLTERANLGKATFYLHYKDKDDLLYECMDSVLGELTEEIQLLPATRWSKNDDRPPRIAFEFAAKNAHFIKTMMNDAGGQKFFRKLQKIVVDLLEDTMQADMRTYDALPVIPIDVLCNYYAGSMLAIIEWWIINDMKYTIDEMVSMVGQIEVLSRERLMGITS